MVHSDKCNCGVDEQTHNHHHEHEHDTSEKHFISVSTHDQSIVGSYKFKIIGSYDEGSKVLSEILQSIGAKVTSTGGIIGHIKAHMTSLEKGCVISVTDEESDLRPTYHNVCTVEGVAIVFGITPQDLKDILNQSLPIA